MSELFFNYHDNSRNDRTNDRELFIFGQAGERVLIENKAGFREAVTLNNRGFSLVTIPFDQSMKGTGVNDLGFKISAEGDISAY
ncbi:MAG: hypothetical protein AAFQ63_19740, partial [Cyanobacteria bacterium J06621_11]